MFPVNIRTSDNQQPQGEKIKTHKFPKEFTWNLLGVWRAMFIKSVDSKAIKSAHRKSY